MFKKNKKGVPTIKVTFFNTLPSIILEINNISSDLMMLKIGWLQVKTIYRFFILKMEKAENNIK